MAKAKVKVEIDDNASFSERWAKKSPEDKKWNFLQIAWMVGAIFVALALLFSITATVMSLVGCAIIYFALMELRKMKKKMVKVKVKKHGK